MRQFYANIYDQPILLSNTIRPVKLISNYKPFLIGVDTQKRDTNKNKTHFRSVHSYSEISSYFFFIFRSVIFDSGCVLFCVLQIFWDLIVNEQSATEWVSEWVSMTEMALNFDLCDSLVLN